MATLVDAVGVLKTFGVYDTILPFMLVMAGTYAVLTKYKPFGETKGANAIISLIVGLVFISFAKAVLFINMLIPVMTIFLIMIVLALLIFAFIGVKAETIAGIFQERKSAFGIVLLLFLLMIFIVISSVMPEGSLLVQNPVLAQQLNITPTGGPGATPIEQASAYLGAQMNAILLSPQILGLIVMIIVFMLSAYFITRERTRM